MRGGEEGRVERGAEGREERGEGRVKRGKVGRKRRQGEGGGRKK